MCKRSSTLAFIALFLRRNRSVPERKKQWRFNLLCSLFITLFMLCFQPFELFLSERWGMAFFLTGYGFITFGLIFLFTHCLPHFLPQVFACKRWTEGKQLLLYLIFCLAWSMVGCCYTRSFVCMPDEPLIVSYFQFQGYSFLLLLLPVSYLELYVRTVRFKRLGEGSIPATSGITEEVKPEAMRLAVGNGKSKLSFFADELCYIEASGNYIRVVLCRQGKVSSSLARCSISEAQRQTDSLKHIVRCHRRYIVNIRNAVGLKQREHDLFLSFPQCNMLVPLSRERAAAVKVLFAEEKQGE
ncbi:MAG: histidine kinase [Bacteroidetes bacterium]|nr:histidine kinase [Bacteroidota bacterium]